MLWPAPIGPGPAGREAVNDVFVTGLDTACLLYTSKKRKTLIKHLHSFKNVQKLAWIFIFKKSLFS